MLGAICLCLRNRSPVAAKLGRCQAREMPSSGDAGEALRKVNPSKLFCLSLFIVTSQIIGLLFFSGLSIMLGP